jgi:hypothetical protein
LITLDEAIAHSSRELESFRSCLSSSSPSVQGAWPIIAIINLFLDDPQPKIPEARFASGEGTRRSIPVRELVVVVLLLLLREVVVETIGAKETLGCRAAASEEMQNELVVRLRCCCDDEEVCIIESSAEDMSIPPGMGIGIGIGIGI